MYCWQNSKKALLGEGNNCPPPPPPLATLVLVPCPIGMQRVTPTSRVQNMPIGYHVGPLWFAFHQSAWTLAKRTTLAWFGLAQHCCSASTSPEIQEFSGIFVIFKDIIFFSREKTKYGISSIMYNWYIRLEPFCKISGYFVKYQEFSEFISGYLFLKSGSTAALYNFASKSSWTWS